MKTHDMLLLITISFFKICFTLFQIGLLHWICQPIGCGLVMTGAEPMEEVKFTLLQSESQVECLVGAALSPDSPSETSVAPLECNWLGCGLHFQAVEQLVFHLREVHLFASQHCDQPLRCFWQGCDNFDAHHHKHLTVHVLFHAHHTELKVFSIIPVLTSLLNYRDDFPGVGLGAVA